VKIAMPNSQTHNLKNMEKFALQGKLTVVIVESKNCIVFLENMNLSVINKNKSYKLKKREE
jgi:hypothetical protein